MIEGRRQIGTAMDLDVAQQQTIVSNQRAAIPPLEQQLAQATDALALLIGKPPEQVAAAQGSLYPNFFTFVGATAEQSPLQRPDAGTPPRLTLGWGVEF